LISQMKQGCGQIGCSNSRACSSANPELLAQLGVEAKDQAMVVQRAVRLQLEGEGAICEH